MRISTISGESIFFLVALTFTPFSSVPLDLFVPFKVKTTQTKRALGRWVGRLAISVFLKSEPRLLEGKEEEK